MAEKINAGVALLVIAISIVSSVVTVLISYAVFKATTVLKLQNLGKSFDAFVSEATNKMKDMETETKRIAMNQQAKITSIASLEKKFDQFRDDHIREISSVTQTLEKNTQAIHELTGTLDVLRDFMKR